MLTQWTNIIIRKFLSFIDISTYHTYESFLSFCLRFWFYMFLIVSVCHRFFIIHHTSLCHGTDKHSVCIQIHILLHFQCKEGIDIFWKEGNTIVCTQHIPSFEFICFSSALESKSFKHFKRCFHGETVDIHHTSLLDDIMRIIRLIDVDCHTVWIVCQLCNGVDDQSVILLTVS